MRQQVSLERKKKNLMFLTFSVTVFIYICANLLFGEMGLIKYIELRNTEDRLKREIVLIEKEKMLLKSQVDALKKDSFYIEKYAREEFGLARPDEYIFQFQEESPQK